MPFIDCVFLATHKPGVGCTLSSIYPSKTLKSLSLDLEKILSPRDADMSKSVWNRVFAHSQAIRFFIGKNIVDSTDDIDIVSKPFDSVVFVKNVRTMSINPIVICFVSFGL